MPVTFEQTTFPSPSSSLTINANGGDTVTIAAFDSLFNTPSITLAGSGGGNRFVLDAAERLPDGVALTLTGDAEFGVNGLTETIGSLSDPVGGTLVSLGAGTLVTGGNRASTTYAGTTTGTGVLAKAGDGVFRLAGTVGVDTAIVETGTLLVNGTLNAAQSVQVHSGGALGGTGTIAATGGVLVSPGGTLDPGELDSNTDAPLPGRLTVNGDVELHVGATFRVQLGGLAAGLDYDQLQVNGRVDLSGLLDGTSGAVMDAALTYTPTWASQWRIMDNDATEGIETRFQDLPDGAWVTVSGVLMNVSYRAGEQFNDVVLTAPGQFDFDGGSFSTQSDYRSVWGSDLYTTVKGYGWSRVVYSFDRGAPDALLRDGHYGQDATFLVDLPTAGDYLVNVAIGDAAPFYHDQIEVTAEGASAPQLKLSTQPGQWSSLSFVVTVLDGTLNLQFRDAGGADPNFVVNALRIRPVSANPITLERTTPAGSDALDADGTTVDTYAGTGAPADAWITVTTTLGTIDASQDVSSTYQGVQVLADTAGAFTFQIRRPSSTGGSGNVTATITAQEVQGRNLGSMMQEYQPAQSPETVLRFDFNASATYTQEGFTGVGARDLYSGTRGYGWSTRVAAADRNSGNVWSNLNRDLHTGSNATFKVQVGTGSYNVRVYLANPLGSGGYAYTYDNFEVIVEGSSKTAPVASLTAGAVRIEQFTGAEAGHDTNGNGILEIQFIDRGGQNFNWVVSGLEISTGSLGTAVDYLMADGNSPVASAAGSAITDAVLAPLVAEAAARWSAAGLTPAQSAVLSDLHVGVADLGGSYLGMAYLTTNEIRIDDDAAGWGWSGDRGQESGDRGQGGDWTGSFLNPEPWILNPERRTLNPVPCLLTPEPRSLNPGLDLMHVLMHEIGHLLGYEHEEDGLMAPVLAAGDSSAEAVEPLGRAQWRSGGWGDLDDVLAELALDASDEGTATRVVRRGGMQRYARDADACFADLVSARGNTANK